MAGNSGVGGLGSGFHLIAFNLSSHEYRYRIFADLLTTSPSPITALLSSPTSIPSSASTASRVTAAESKQSMDQETLESQGLNPATQLQHPGIYYYTAAESILIRRQKFVEVSRRSFVYPASTYNSGRPPCNLDHRIPTNRKSII